MHYDLADYISLRHELTRKLQNIIKEPVLTFSEALEIAESILEDLRILPPESISL
jgi:hypothetical protein